jgi:hypothetical protein
VKVTAGRSGVSAEALDAGPVAIVALQGLGGVGKSQVALEFAHQGRSTGTYGLTWWIRAEASITLLEDLAALVPVISAADSAKRQEAARNAVTKLQGLSGWLLVFDNTLNAAEVRPWLPAGSGHILITSRERGSWAQTAESFDLAEFTRTESLAYLRGRLRRDDPEASALATALGDLPLALAQACSYLDLHDGLPIRRYLQLYHLESGPATLLATGVDPAYPGSVATTWLMHFAELRRKDPAALQLLQLCAHLRPDRIDLTLILSEPSLLDAAETSTLATAIRSPLERDATVGALTRTGLLNRLKDDYVGLPGTSNREHFRIHRLVA